MNKVEEHKRICTELNKMYENKNADYGDSFTKVRNEFGDLALLVRLSDKVERLKKLSVSGGTKVAESKEDTLLDLANYCIMELVEINCERREMKCQKEE